MSDTDSNEFESDEEGYSANDFDFLKGSADISGGTAGLECELKVYEARYNYKGERRPLEVGKQRPQISHVHTSALVFIRQYNREHEVESTELTIRSPYLKQALKEVIKEYPGINLKTGNIVITGLPKCLFHYRNELRAYGLELEHNAYQHLLLLLKHMWEQLQAQWGSYYNLMESDFLTPGLEFANLWMAFKPGDQLYMKVQGNHRIMKLKNMQMRRSNWRIDFLYIADDGTDVGYVEDDCLIEKYDGYRPLVNLEVFPLRYHPDAELIKAHTISRGAQMILLRGVQYRMYHGQTEALGTQRRHTYIGQIDVFQLQSTEIKSRIIIDAETFAKKNPNNKVFIDPTLGRLPMYEGTHLYNLSDEHFMICDHSVPGFSLAEKKWCWFDLANISDIEFNTRAFEKLLLPQDQKDMIYSLVEVHKNNNLSFDDVIKGKGKGMVFLLHGAPGVGKTLTAESVADQTKRPLYTISCGELGVEPNMVESKLKAALDLATTWNAIVLIDEADVFLQQRSMNDLERNSLVSIFLRLMEYYEGIMILTTNRIEAFDEAFKSRIHLAIKFHALSPEYRAKLWKSFIMSTVTTEGGEWLNLEAKQGLDLWLTDEYLDEIGKEELNGRQIKNTVRTANALAISGKVQLSPNHIETALRAMRMFESDFAESHERAERPTSNKRRRIS